MQKVTSFLEKNVEWLVLGLAGLWVLYVVWFYVVNPPVMAEINGREFTPAAVDEAILRVAEADLAPKLDHHNIPPFDVPDFSERFVAEMGPKPVEPLAISVANLQSVPQRTQLEGPGGIPGMAEKVDALAEVPAPVIGQPVVGRDQVQIQVDPNNPKVLFRPNMPLPAGVQPQPMRTDKYWVTIPAVFDENLLDKAFADAKLPVSLRRRNYLSVEVMREEATGVDQQGNYIWGNPTLVPPIQLVSPPVAKNVDFKAFADWVLKPENQPIVLQPPFYQTLTKPWVPPIRLPQEQEGFVNQGQNEFQTLLQQAKDGASAYSAMKSLPISDQLRFRQALPPNLRQELYVHEQEIERQKREARRPPPQPERPSRSRNNSPLRSAAMYGLTAQVRAGAEGPMIDGAAGGYQPTANNQPYQPAYRPGEEVPGMLSPAMFQVGGGQGAPPQVLQIWAHDETVEPGKIYRYKLRVTVRNPVFDTRNVVSDPKLAEVAELPPADKPEQGWSAWTEPVRVPTRLDFFVQGATPGQNPQVKFNIYRWQNGKYNLTTTQNLQPGDVIGTMQPDAGSPQGQSIDYSTGWAVVDVRSASGNDVRVLLMDPQGRTETRYMKSDQQDPRQRILSLEMQNPAQAAVNVNR